MGMRAKGCGPSEVCTRMCAYALDWRKDACESAQLPKDLGIYIHSQALTFEHLSNSFIKHL